VRNGNGPDEFTVLKPDLQVSFYQRLQVLRGQYLSEALAETIGTLDIAVLDDALQCSVDAGALRKVAEWGIRGEVIFPVAYVIEAKPGLLGYYRLLLGFSEKEFYHRDAFGMFRSLEKRGVASDGVAPLIPELCASLVRTAEMLVTAVPKLGLRDVHELQLLSLGASLRGSELNRIGQRATAETFDLIKKMLEPHITASDSRTLRLSNDSGRQVTVAFAGDPDVVFVESLPSREKPFLCIEIKGGSDGSNVYNRIGEAEKSHNTQLKSGCREFWTIIRAPFRLAAAKEKSPTTTRFFRLDEVTSQGTEEHACFREELSSIVGIKIPG